MTFTSKYAIGQTLFFASENKLKVGIIISMSIDHSEDRTSEGYTIRDEKRQHYIKNVSELFETKEELLEVVDCT